MSKKEEEKEEKKEEKKEEVGSIVEETLDELIPGFGKMVKKLKAHSPELQEKIKETDKEIAERLEKGYSSKPKITTSFTVRSLTPGEKTVKRKAEKPKIAEPVVDIFEEESTIRIIAEFPGIDEKNITVTKNENRLILEAHEGVNRYRKEIELPCPAEESDRQYHNGILEIILNKHAA